MRKNRWLSSLYVWLVTSLREAHLAAGTQAVRLA